MRRKTRKEGDGTSPWLCSTQRPGASIGPPYDREVSRNLSSTANGYFDRPLTSHQNGVSDISDWDADTARWRVTRVFD
jgi:hypothetical protein